MAYWLNEQTIPNRALCFAVGERSGAARGSTGWHRELKQFIHYLFQDATHLMVTSSRKERAELGLAGPSCPKL